jgi:hypothetical protein
MIFVVTHFWIPHKKKRRKYKKIKNIFGKKIQNNNNSEKRMPKRPEND